jgi:hypothetical protein
VRRGLEERGEVLLGRVSCGKEEAWKSIGLEVAK